MGVKNTWSFRSSSPPSCFRETPTPWIDLDRFAQHQRAKSDSATRPDGSMHKEDSPGGMSPKPPLKPPGLIDSHHSDHDGRKDSYTDDLSADLAAKELKRALKRVVQLGNKLYGRRLELKEKRNGLHHAHEVLAELESRFVKTLHQLREDPKERFDESICNQIIAQRDVIGSFQYDYDQAEDEYDIHENHFEQEGKTLLNLLSRLRNQNNDGEDVEESMSDSSSDIHPFRIAPESSGPTDAKMTRLLEYESRIGDARIVQEQLEDLRFEQGRRLSISKKREKFGIGRNASETSETFELRYAEAAKELSIINEDVQRLQEALQLDGYSLPELSAGKEPESVPVPPQPISPSFSTQRLKARSSSEGKMPLLAQQMAAMRDRIHRWMFATFKDSPVEHVRHKVILRDLCPLDDETWAHVVPEYWTDNAGTPDDRFHPPMLRSGLSKATEAMKTFERDFPPIEAPKDRATPYDYKLEFDLLSEYECRSH